MYPQQYMLNVNLFSPQHRQPQPDLKDFFRHHHSSFVFYSSCLHTLSSPRGIRASFVRFLACFFCGNSIPLHLGTKVSPFENLLWKFFVVFLSDKNQRKTMENFSLASQWEKFRIEMEAHVNFSVTLDSSREFPMGE